MEGGRGGGGSTSSGGAGGGRLDRQRHVKEGILPDPFDLQRRRCYRRHPRRHRCRCCRCNRCCRYRSVMTGSGR
jgi:hypothetical protein